MGVNLSIKSVSLFWGFDMKAGPQAVVGATIILFDIVVGMVACGLPSARAQTVGDCNQVNVTIGQQCTNWAPCEPDGVCESFDYQCPDGVIYHYSQYANPKQAGACIVPTLVSGPIWCTWCNNYWCAAGFKYQALVNGTCLNQQCAVLSDHFNACVSGVTPSRHWWWS